LKVSGRLSVDTNAVIAYREGVTEICNLVEEANEIFLTVSYSKIES